MAKVLLVSPPYYKPYSKGQFIADSMPLGLGYIAAYALSKLEIDVKIIDYGIEKYSDDIWKQEITDYCPDIIGFSALTLGYRQVIKMAKIVGELKRSITILSGGAHSTIMPNDMLERCDIAVRGEGEISFFEILSGKRLQDIDGITYNRDGCVWSNKDRQRIDNLDELPMPAYQLFDYKMYRQHSIIGSRGCPYNCVFCASPVLWNRIMKLRTPANIVNEIQFLNTTYDVKHIVFQDDTFNLTPQRGIEICDEIMKRGLNISFSTQMRANKECVSNDLFERMKQANCVDVTFGIETGSNKVMKSLNKHLTVKEAGNAVKMAHQAGIRHVKGFFMVGNWNETTLDIVKTWYFIIRNPIDTVLTVCTPLPATDFFAKLKTLGYIDKVDWTKVDWVTPVSRTDKMSKSTILLFYYMTVIFIHLPAHIRSGNPKGLIKGIWNFGMNKLRLVSAK